MKTLLLTAILVETAAANATAQGKVTFGNDFNHLIMLSSFLPPDVYPCGDLAGLAVPQAGSANACNLGAFTAALLAGTSANSLAVVLTTPAGATNLADGRLPNISVTLNGIPAGSPAYFQVRIYDGESYFNNNFEGESPVFTVVPGSIVGTPLASPLPPGNSTWKGPIAVSTCLDGLLVVGEPQPPAQAVPAGATVSFTVPVHACPRANCQWLFNGTPIAGATASRVVITNAQPSDTGKYSVHAYNEWRWPPPPWGDRSHDVLSSNATLVVFVSPEILSPPQTQTAEVGSSVAFSSWAIGLPPPTYRWFFNGNQPVSPTTIDSHLQLTNIQLSASGLYTVVVTNPYGAATSPPAVLSVIPAVPRKMVPCIAVTAPPASLMNIDYVTMMDGVPNWGSFPTFYLTNPPQFFFDLTEPLPGQRFYRGWHSNPLAPPPVLDLHMVPAITLTGAAGSTLRLDSINQFGPIDAWVPLATNTLTSTSQFYFDTSSIGQPARLWRIVPVP